MPIRALTSTLPRLALVTALLLPQLASAGDVAVDGSDRKVSDTRHAAIAGKGVDLKLTGTGLREKAFINVYVIASYVESGKSPHSAGELSSLDAPKQMVLTMERDVEGPKMAEALSEAIRGNYPAGMDAELGQLEGWLKAHPLNKDDEVVFTWQPGGTLTAGLGAQVAVTIKSPEFAHAVWDIWLGKNPVQSNIKKGLAERL